MPAVFEPHLPSQYDKVEIDVTVEEDDGVFLGINARDFESGDDVFDLVTTDPSEIEEFFRLVAKAQKEWDRRKAIGS